MLSQQKKKILVIRFSSLGDVILTIPVFKTLSIHCPAQKFLLVTRPAYAALFDAVENVEVIPIDVDDQYKGPIGLKKLANHLMTFEFNIVVDLHDVLRTKVVRNLLQLKGKEVVVFDKGRKEKKALIDKKIEAQRLPHTTERYLAAFNFLKEGFSLVKGPWLNAENDSSKKVDQIVYDSKSLIGLAPFTKHRSKEWLNECWLQLIERLQNKHTILVFAFSPAELRTAKIWKKQYPSLQLIDSSYSMQEQISLIAKLNVMISCDSANMHLASVLGTKVISLWFATHPAIGFGPLNNEEGIVQPSEKKAPERPISVYGKIRKKDVGLVDRWKEMVRVEDVLEKV